MEYFYNDYNHESMTNSRMKAKSDGVYNLVKDLKERDCGITGVGFQTHISVGTTDDDLEGIRQNIKRYNDLGLTVHFTEVDIKCDPKFEPSIHCRYEWTDELYE